jgi:hypothetical protein
MYGDFPAKNTACTPYVPINMYVPINIWLWPSLSIRDMSPSVLFIQVARASDQTRQAQSGSALQPRDVCLDTQLVARDNVS